MICGNSFSGLGRRLESGTMSLWLKSNPGQAALTPFNSIKAQRDEESAEERFEARRDPLMRLKERSHLHSTEA